MKKYPEMNDEEKEVMWDDILHWMILNSEERELLEMPVTKTQICEFYNIPISTFYNKLHDEQFMKKLVKHGLIKAKGMIPKLLKKLEENVEEGKEKSIELALKYIAEVAEKLDHTTKGEQIKSINYIVPDYVGDNTEALDKAAPSLPSSEQS